MIVLQINRIITSSVSSFLLRFPFPFLFQLRTRRLCLYLTSENQSIVFKRKKKLDSENTLNSN